MKDCAARAIPFWENQVIRNVQKNKQILIVSHKNTLRALFKHIQGLEEDGCKKIVVPNAAPIIYEFDDNMSYLRNYSLEDSESLHQESHSQESEYSSISSDECELVSE